MRRGRVPVLQRLDMGRGRRLHGRISSGEARDAQSQDGQGSEAMNIKEAIQILEQFKTIAGEDAPCDIERLQLVGASEYVIEEQPYSYTKRTGSRKVAYTVAATIMRRDVALAEGDCGLVNSRE
jgi:hypothetical protein